MAESPTPDPLAEVLAAYKLDLVDNATGDGYVDTLGRITSARDLADAVRSWLEDRPTPACELIAAPNPRKLILHIEVEGFYADDLNECAAFLTEPDPPDAQARLDVVTQEWMREAVGITLVSLPGEKSLTSDFEVRAYTGRIVGADLSGSDRG